MNKTSGAVSQQAEHGQAIVLIVLAIFAMFGFAALAIDFGQVFMIRRSSQSAADNAAMAAAFEAVGASMDHDTAIAKAYEMASINGFNNDRVTNWVEVHNPPQSGPYCSICGSPEANEYYQVTITVRMAPVFAQFVYSGAQETTVEAIAHAQEVGSMSAEDTLLSLSPDLDSMLFDGAVKVKLDGGNIRSLGGMTKNGAGSGSIVVTNGHVYFATQFSGSTVPFSPTKPSKNIAAQMASFKAPYCPSEAELEDGTWADGSGFKTKEIDDVNYYYYPSGLSVEKLLKGVHCVDGGIPKGDYKGKGVLIVLLSGGMKLTGNDSMNIKAPLNLIDANGNQFGGMMFYAPSTNTSKLEFGGNQETYMQGTFFAPGAFCEFGGTGDSVTHHTSLICDKIKIHGNPLLSMKYKEEELFRLPPFVELVQ